MPLSFASIGKPMIIKEIKGKSDIYQRLKTMGFIEGQKIMVIEQSHGNLIVALQQCRVAINEEIALKIIVREELCN